MDTLTVLIAGLVFIQAGRLYGSGTPTWAMKLHEMVLELSLYLVGAVLFLVALINAL